MPVCSTAGATAAGVPAAAAAAAVGQISGACLTARQLLQLLLQAQHQQPHTAQKQERAAGDVCRVLLGAADRHWLEAAMHADG
jgi:hypothetical protein